MDFNKENSHPRDQHIHFEPEGHTYTVHEMEYLSVTTFINRFFKQFDANYWAEKKAPKMGKTPEELLEEWRLKGEAAALQGKVLHDNIEKFLLGQPHGEEGSFHLFRKFHRENPALLPYRTEWTIYDEEHQISGTIDLLDGHKGMYSLYDWKCSSKLIGNNGEVITTNPFREKGLHPITHLDNTSYHHYALQQSMYRYILEKHYGIQLRACSLVVLHPNYTDYRVIKLPYLYHEIAAMLAVRKSTLIQQACNLGAEIL